MPERFFVYRAYTSEGWQPPQYHNEELVAWQQDTYDYLQSRIGISDPAVEQEIASIQDFNDKLGLRTPPFLMFEATEETLAVIGTRVLATKLKNPAVEGLYDPNLDIAFLAVNRSSSPSMSKAVRMHEAAHGNGGVHINGVWIGPNEVYTQKRVGLNVVRHNRKSQALGELYTYIDEGRSELLAATYNAIEHGYKGHVGTTCFGVELPAKYVHRVGEHGVVLTPGTLAAPGLELLIHKDEAILDGLLYGASDFNALRRLYHTLNAIRPGLRRDLGSVRYGFQPSADMTSQLISELYAGEASIVAKASVHTQQLIQRKLEAGRPLL